MINRYIDHINSKPTHERRKHAAQVAAAVTGVVFLGWLGTLGMRLSGGTTPVANDAVQQTQLANVVNAQDGSSAMLEVASTTNGTDLSSGSSDTSGAGSSYLGQ